MKRIDKAISPIDRDLDYFLELFRHGSISKAADYLDMDQGNLSRALSRLEKKIGEKLFHRHQKGLVPTEKAKSLTATLHGMKELWGTSFKNDNSKDSKIRGNLKIGFHPSVGQTYLPPILQVLQDLAQGTVEFRMGTSSEMVNEVMNRQIDLAIAVNPIKSKDLIVKPLGLEQIELVSLTDQKVDNEKTLLISPEMLFQGKIVKGLSLMKVIHISNYEIIAEVCRQNSNYIGVIPSAVRKRYSDLKTLRSLRDGISVNLVTFPGSKISRYLTELISS